ncbi:hypothetical protein E4T56_gene6591 [Termitomyces sp. T112]|nr:hypothetical protein E4T56_gene6591 [Termitomyces sp. T112]
MRELTVVLQGQVCFRKVGSNFRDIGKHWCISGKPWLQTSCMEKWNDRSKLCGAFVVQPLEGVDQLKTFLPDELIIKMGPY